MDELVDKTMANLKLIGMIKKGEKVCLRKGQLNIEYVDRLQSLRRWYNKDSRDISLNHIRNTINDAIKIAKGLITNTIQSDMKVWTVSALNQELKNCENGMQNLKTTYIDDPSFLANIEVLLDKCKAQADEIDKALYQYVETQNIMNNSGMSAGDSSVSIKRVERQSRNIDKS